MGLHDALGGIEQVTYNYVSRIGNACDGAIEFSFASMHGKIAYQEEYEKMGCKMFRLPDVKKNPVGCARGLFKIIRDEKIDAVHYNMLSAANIGPLLIARAAGCKRVIAHAHNTGAVGLHKRILHYINRIFIPYLATDLFSCSAAASRFMFGKDKNAALVRNAIDVKRFSYNLLSRTKVRDELGIDDDASVIGHVGRFAEQKNHPFLIEVFRSIAQKDESAKLLLAGSGHAEPKIRGIVDRYGLADRVIFYGTSQNVHELYSAMDAFLFPSLFEGLGIVCIEAQCCGLCVVASDVIPKNIDIAELVKWRRLSDPPECWADAVIDGLRLRRRDDMSAVIGGAGYDIDIEAERFLTLTYRF
jgi:glycosyltransferase involved in cell wall biosynthesis